MRYSLKNLFALSLLAYGALLTGCATKTAEESTIPWSRPAAWEGGIPGMGSLPGAGGGYGGR
jgi:hypothetical protein